MAVSVFENKNDIFALMDKFDKSTLSEMEISAGSGENEIKIKLSKNPAYLPEAKNLIPMPAFVPAAIPAAEMKKEETEEKIVSAGFIIKSPLVGTFYTSPSPESGPYVKTGDRITKGTVLCIIEAMKTMNEIESETDGEIAEILAKDGSPVEYGQPLFRLK